MIEMRRRQMHGVNHSCPFRDHFHSMSNPAELTAPARTFLTLPGQFIPIGGIQPAIFHHHTTAFLPTLMVCLPWLPTPPTPQKNHRTNPARRLAAVQSGCASVRPLWQTCVHACPGRPVSVPAAMQSYRSNPLPRLPPHHTQARPPYM